MVTSFTIAKAHSLHYDNINLAALDLNITNYNLFNPLYDFV